MSIAQKETTVSSGAAASRECLMEDVADGFRFSPARKTTPPCFPPLFQANALVFVQSQEFPFQIGGISSFEVASQG